MDDRLSGSEVRSTPEERRAPFVAPVVEELGELSVLTQQTIIIPP